jgi:hypothetical protein
LIIRERGLLLFKIGQFYTHPAQKLKKWFAYLVQTPTFAAPNSSLGIYCIGSQRYNCEGAITKKM